MDGLQPLDAAPRPIVATVPAPPTMANLPAKTPGNYLRALRRRCWVILLIAVPLATAGILMILRMTPIYSVTAQIVIDPPRIDPKVSGIIGHGDIGAADPSRAEHYVPNALAVLTSKQLVAKVLADPSLELPRPTEGDIADLSGRIKYRPVPKSQHQVVTLEGADQERLAKILNVWLVQFQKTVENENDDLTVGVEDFASRSLNTYREELKKIQGEVDKILRESTTLAPGGKNLMEIQYEQLEGQILHEEGRFGQISEGFELQAFDRHAGGGSGEFAAKLGELNRERKFALKRYSNAKRIAKDLLDPALTKATAELKEIDDQIAEIQAVPQGETAVGGPNAATEAFLSRWSEKIDALQGRKRDLLGLMKAGLPDYQNYLSKLRERELKEKQIEQMSAKLSDFKMMSSTQKSPVQIVDRAVDPILPIRPRKTMYIGGWIVACLGLGIAVVCLLEFLDNSVKVPEHLTAGLALPLFGVVPRIRREARNHRGGHLWTHGTPDSIEADAFRNLRASLLGAGSRTTHPIQTLLVTSAKAGEGKSTTALNLAATCARAGERTLLIDVDLRRPSLLDVFPPQEHGLGLVDVLRGDLPWQRTVVQSEIPNLDFLPTGDTRDVPIEVLGSLELRQLLRSLSQHHYDRVILDGPAVLGLADCRMLGRIVDASLMVVRCGSQGLRPLQRAKTMLEQSQVHIAGVVFNSLDDDLQNWSSYGPNFVAYPALAAAPRSGSSSRGLGGPDRAPAAANAPALATAGAHEG